MKICELKKNLHTFLHFFFSTILLDKIAGILEEFATIAWICRERKYVYGIHVKYCCITLWLRNEVIHSVDFTHIIRSEGRIHQTWSIASTCSMHMIIEIMRIISAFEAIKCAIILRFSIKKWIFNNATPSD